MINIKIDNNNIQIPKGTTVLNAAKSVGIEIPTMCFLEGQSNHPSCMICVVKDKNTGKLFPSCAITATEGMEIISKDEEIINARKESLELLLSDHVGDCEAPCRPSCPANMNIPLMNRLIAEGKFSESNKVVKEDIALPLILGYICPAPCEKACRRTQVDNAVSICHLKKSVAAEDLNNENSYLPPKEKKSNKKVAIIGTGPGGLSAAFYLLKWGHECVLFDKNEEAGGTLRYEILENQLPNEAINKEVSLIKEYGAEFRMNYLITKEIYETELKKNFDAIILATGDFETSNFKDFEFESGKSGITIDKGTYETSEEGVFACGNIIRSRRMAINSVAQGKIAANSANIYLKGEKPQKAHRMFNSKFGKLFEAELDEYMKEAVPEKRIELEKGKMGDFSKEEAILEAKRCMHCDCRKVDDCKLRTYSDQYNADQRKYKFGERKTIKKYNQHDTVIYEPEKCIRCNLCVDITVKNGELTGLTSVGRGFNVQIDVPFGESMKNALTETAIKCAEACPTGAISLKH
ncbi:MAG: hypothetical protein DRJ10_03760 [Bacteroidetes bacterium]|nr:MAG: hypothetical protein DRJ10_03760 [Bacteroidota bacterium]